MTFLRRWGLLVLGAAFVVVGIVFAGIDGLRPHAATFGWTAYALLTETTFRPPGLSMYGDGPEVLICLGLLVIAVWFALRRSASPRFELAAAIGIPAIGAVIGLVGVILAQSADEVLSASSGEPAGYALVGDGGPGITVIDSPHAVLALALIVLGTAIVAGSLGYLVARRNPRKGDDS